MKLYSKKSKLALFLHAEQAIACPFCIRHCLLRQLIACEADMKL